MDDLQAAREFFSADAYATGLSGIVIEDAAPDYARCSMRVTPQHLNARGVVMGGALFTLADFTAGVAANTGRNADVTVALTGQISFLQAAKGHGKLTAETVCDKSGRSSSCFRVLITDEDGVLVAASTITGFRLSASV